MNIMGIFCIDASPASKVIHKLGGKPAAEYTQLPIAQDLARIAYFLYNTVP